jgi:hypothetical protein
MQIPYVPRIRLVLCKYTEDTLPVHLTCAACGLENWAEFVYILSMRLGTNPEILRVLWSLPICVPNVHISRNTEQITKSVFPMHT